MKKTIINLSKEFIGIGLMLIGVSCLGAVIFEWTQIPLASKALLILIGVAGTMSGLYVAVFSKGVDE